MVFVGKGSFFLLVGFKWPMPSSHWEAFSLDSSPRKFIKKKSFRLKMPMVNISWDTEVEDASLSLSLSHGTQMWAAYSHQPSSPTQRTFTCKEQFQFCFFFHFVPSLLALVSIPDFHFPSQRDPQQAAFSTHSPHGPLVCWACSSGLCPASAHCSVHTHSSDPQVLTLLLPSLRMLLPSSSTPPPWPTLISRVVRRRGLN